MCPQNHQTDIHRVNCSHLVWPTEDVGVVLLETAHAGQAAQGARCLITVQRACIGIAG